MLGMVAYPLLMLHITWYNSKRPKFMFIGLNIGKFVCALFCLFMGKVDFNLRYETFVLFLFVLLSRTLQSVD